MRARRSIGEFINEAYNTRRLHSALACRPPREFGDLFSSPGINAAWKVDGPEEDAFPVRGTGSLWTIPPPATADRQPPSS